MDEKKIEQIIARKLGLWDEPALRTDEGMAIRGEIADAAHAIAERMREGVVWEGLGTVRHQDEWDHGALIITASLHFDELPPGWLLNVGDCERVQVTVRRKG